MSTDLLSQAKITPEAVADLRSKIGLPLRSRNSYNTSSAFDSVRHFCLGIGDDNPLWNDRDYGRKSKSGTNFAPPSFLYSIGIGVVQMGLPGVHGFHGGSDWHWLRPIRQNEEILLHIWLDDVVERTSKMGGKSVVNYFSSVYYTPDNEVLAYHRSWTHRIERGAARDRGKEGSAFEPQIWPPEKLREIEAAYDAEKVQGAAPRYWEDVVEGQALDPIVKGPLCLSDMIAFYAGLMVAPTPAHKIAYKDYKEHPRWWFRNPENGGLEPIVRVHENLAAASSAGVPAPYDVGVQRASWMINLITNWMGDDAFLVRNHCEFRAFNYFGDVQYFSGKVTRKYQENGDHLIDLEISTVNQRGKITTPGSATIALPSRAGGLTPMQRHAAQPVMLDDFLKTLPVPLKR
jgi:acyl dehydratase